MSPQRPRPHVLEELSRQASRAALPAEWVVRPVEDDDGIDREVEIFVDGRATGLTFTVQLRASDRVSRAGPSRRVTTDQLGCWRSLDVPVLIAYMVVETESLYGSWARTLGREHKIEPGAVTTTLTYGAEDLLVDAADRLLVDVVIVRGLRTGCLPQPFELNVGVEDSFTVASQHEAVVHLRSLVRSRSLGSIVEVLPATHGDHRPRFLVQLSGGQSTVLRAGLPVDVSSVRVEVPADVYGQRHGPAAFTTLVSDVLVGMAVALERTGAGGPAARLLDRVARESSIATSPELAPAIAELLDDHEMADEALALAVRLMTAEESDARDASDAYLCAALQHLERVDETSVTELVERMRQRAHQERASGNPRRAGRMHDNIGQVLGSVGERETMLHELDAALVHDPGYQDREYFFRERGGVRWSVGDHLGAAEDYRRALRLGAEPGELRPLLTDALMWAGRCSEASDVLADWTPTGHRLDRLAGLGGIALTEIERLTGLAEQERRSADQSVIETVGDDVERCTELLRTTDALDARLWLHLIQNREPSLPELVVIAMMRQHDALAWAMCTAVAFLGDGEHSRVFSYIVSSATALTDTDAYVAAVVTVADEAMDASSAARLTAALYERIASEPDGRTRTTVRAITDTRSTRASRAPGHGLT